MFVTIQSKGHESSLTVDEKTLTKAIHRDISVHQA